MEFVLFNIIFGQWNNQFMNIKHTYINGGISNEEI